MQILQCGPYASLLQAMHIATTSSECPCFGVQGQSLELQDSAESLHNICIIYWLMKGFCHCAMDAF